MKARTLTKYNVIQQYWGTYLQGFKWDAYGCLTYSKPISLSRAEARLPEFITKLEGEVGPVAYFAALEKRYSGCGMPAVPLHWHLLVGSPDQDRALLLASKVRSTWKHGYSKAEPYDPSQGATFYISKLANNPDGHLEFGKMALIEHAEVVNVREAIQTNPYVPDRLKDKTHGEYLVVK